jgi:GT2 family glycosyltransferase
MIDNKMQNTIPNISVVIVSWNAKKYLEQCLESILSCSDASDAEIIVVDNASTDGSPELVKQRFADVKLIRNSSNLGFAKANNIGIGQSHGKYLFLINSDVVVYPNCFSSMANYIEAQPQIGVLGPRIIGFDGKVQRSCMGYPTLWNKFCRAIFLATLFPRLKLFNGYELSHWSHDEVKEVDVINGCFWAIKRQAIEEIGLLDENFFMYAEDIDWCKRFNNAGWKVVYYPKAEAVHFGGASSSNAPIRFYIEMQNANLRFWGKHYGSFSRCVYICIIFLHQSLRALGYSIYYLLAPAKKDVSLYKIKRSVASILALLKIKVDW